MIGSVDNVNAVLEMVAYGPGQNYKDGEVHLKLVVPDISLRTFIWAWSQAAVRKVSVVNQADGKVVCSMYLTDANPGGSTVVDSSGTRSFTKDGKPFVPGTEVVTHKQ